MTGSGDKKIGEFSLIEIDSSEVTMDALEDWYFNYVSVNDYNWCMILYTDYDDNTGIYGISGLVQVDVIFAVEKENPKEYYIGSTENATTYYPSDDGTLIDSETFYNDDEQEEETNE